MRLLKKIVPPALLLGAVVAAQACTDPPDDSTRTDRRLFQVKGVIQGAVTYTGQRPCSQNGHIVGTAVLLVFDAHNPPPPAGLANTAINFGVVPGDVLFANEPRNPQSDLYCPKDHGITDTILVGAPFVISPMDQGQYIIQAFYDYTGDFLPTFKIRNLPELTDVLGGYVDTTDAAKHVGDINYQPIFLPIDIGYPDPKSPSGFTIPDSGFVADNVGITIGSTAPLPRPYFYPKGSDKAATGVAQGSPEMDPNYVPVITMPQDWHVKAQPSQKSEDNINAQQASFVQLDMQAGVPANELMNATTLGDPKLPFHFQIGPKPTFFVWEDPIKKIPETPLIPQLWPLVVFAKLKDDRSTDPQNLVPLGSATDPVVILQGLALANDRLFNSTDPPFGIPIPKSPADPLASVDHMRVLVRPSVICFHTGNAIAEGGILVTPYFQGEDPGSDPVQQRDIADLPSVIRSNPQLLKQGVLPREACLPTGRYGINLVYPTGQAWTVPNEAGNCAVNEGAITGDPGSQTCSNKTRPVLYSQGTRAVLEITPAMNPANCAGTKAVPDECLPCAQRANAANFAECK